MDKKIVCKDCGKELPLDSKFCQYCGSKNIGNVVEQIKIEEPSKLKLSEENLIKDVSEKETKPKSYKVCFIVALIVAILCGYGWYAQYSSSNDDVIKLSSDLNTANNKINSLESQLTNYKDDSEKYDMISEIANQTIYSNFRADNYFVKGTKNVVNVYCNFYGSYTIYPEVYGQGVSIEWGDWNGSGYECHCPLYITSTLDGYGVITLTNDYNNNTLKIFVSGK